MTRILVNVTIEVYKNAETGGGKLPLCNKLKEFRRKKGINQLEMGKNVGVSRQTISQIERGDYSPSVTLAIKLAHYFEVSVEDIFEIAEKKETKDK